MESLELIVVLAMVLVNAVFAGYEIALASISVSRLQVLINENRSGAQAALEMKEGIERSLAVVQLGITLVGLIAGATSGASAGDDLAPILQRWGMSETFGQRGGDHPGRRAADCADDCHRRTGSQALCFASQGVGLFAAIADHVGFFFGGLAVGLDAGNIGLIHHGHGGTIVAAAIAK